MQSLQTSQTKFATLTSFSKITISKYSFNSGINPATKLSKKNADADKLYSSGLFSNKLSINGWPCKNTNFFKVIANSQGHLEPTGDTLLHLHKSKFLKRNKTRFKQPKLKREYKLDRTSNIVDINYYFSFDLDVTLLSFSGSSQKNARVGKQTKKLIAFTQHAFGQII